MARIVVQSFGSRGDIEPFMTFGSGLQARGHEVVFATVEAYRARIESSGLLFHALRPLFDPSDPELLLRATHPVSGVRFLLEEIVFEHIDATFADSLDSLAGADLLLCGSLVFLGPLLGHVTGVRWLRGVLQPSVLLSRSDPPVLSVHPAGRMLRRFPALQRMALRLLERRALTWSRSLLRLERRHDFERFEHPIFGAQGSDGVLALFSKHFARPQTDWGDRTLTTGFLFDPDPPALSPDLERFLAAGDPPVVVTLGSAAIRRGREFFRETIEALRALHLRAVVLADDQELEHLASEEIHLARWAPHGALFARAAAVVHHGGVGTTADALRAAAPMLVVPFAHDQGDNAARIEHLGVGVRLWREGYHSRRAGRAIARLLGVAAYRQRSSQLAAQLDREDGLAAACDAVERCLRRL